MDEFIIHQKATVHSCKPLRAEHEPDTREPKFKAVLQRYPDPQVGVPDKEAVALPLFVVVPKRGYHICKLLSIMPPPRVI